MCEGRPVKALGVLRPAEDTASAGHIKPWQALASPSQSVAPRPQFMPGNLSLLLCPLAPDKARLPPWQGAPAKALSRLQHPLAP